jgi:hypothetical protein
MRQPLERVGTHDHGHLLQIVLADEQATVHTGVAGAGADCCACVSRPVVGGGAPCSLDGAAAKLLLTSRPRPRLASGRLGAGGSGSGCFRPTASRHLAANAQQRAMS